MAKSTLSLTWTDKAPRLLRYDIRTTGELAGKGKLELDKASAARLLASFTVPLLSPRAPLGEALSLDYPEEHGTRSERAASRSPDGRVEVFVELWGPGNPLDDESIPEPRWAAHVDDALEVRVVAVDHGGGPVVVDGVTLGETTESFWLDPATVRRCAGPGGRAQHCITLRIDEAPPGVHALPLAMRVSAGDVAHSLAVTIPLSVIDLRGLSVETRDVGGKKNVELRLVAEATGKGPLGLIETFTWNGVITATPGKKGIAFSMATSSLRAELTLPLVLTGVLPAEHFDVPAGAIGRVVGDLRVTWIDWLTWLIARILGGYATPAVKAALVGLLGPEAAALFTPAVETVVNLLIAGAFGMTGHELNRHGRELLTRDDHPPGDPFMNDPCRPGQVRDVAAGEVTRGEVVNVVTYSRRRPGGGHCVTLIRRTYRQWQRQRCEGGQWVTVDTFEQELRFERVRQCFTSEADRQQFIDQNR